MYPAHTQLVAKCSSPSIGDQRATGCSSYDDVSISKLFWIFWKYTSWSPLPHMMMIIYCDMRIMSWDMMRIIFRPLLALLRLSIIIDYHWLSMIIIDHHWLSLVIIDCHWLSWITIDYHWFSLIIWKSELYQLLTDSLTTWNQEMLVHLKNYFKNAGAQPASF